MSMIARKLLVLIAWVSLGYIAYVTLSPTGLRRVASHNLAYERFVAYDRWRIVRLGLPRANFHGEEYRGRSCDRSRGAAAPHPDRHGRLVDLLRRYASVCSECWLRLPPADTWLALSARLPTNPHVLNFPAILRER
jgi:hypothetical protein